MLLSPHLPSRFDKPGGNRERTPEEGMLPSSSQPLGSGKGERGWERIRENRGREREREREREGTEGCDAYLGWLVADGRERELKVVMLT